MPPLISLKFNTTKLNFTFKFDDNCWYINPTSSINKLYGISYGIIGIHKNSIRIGWIPDKDKNRIKLYYYGYENESDHIGKHIAIIDTNVEYKINMFLYIINGEPMKLCITLNNTSIYDDICKVKINWLGFGCKPYFGGNNTAPNKMSFYIT